MSYVGRLTFGEAIARGLYTNITKWSKMGYVPIGATTDTDIWSFGGTTAVVPLMAAAATVKVRSNHADDLGTAIHSGNSTGGSTTTMADAGANFLGGTPAAAGDCLILDKGGAVPEWGYITNVGAQVLTCAGGFSSGGSGAGPRAYEVLDYSASAGAHAVLINGLGGAFGTQREIVVTGGAGPADVLTTKSYIRFNSFRVIASGANGRPTSYLAIMDNGGVPATTYTYITAAYTRARNIHYTVPSGKTLWISQIELGYIPSAGNNNCRFFTRASQYSFEDGTAPFLLRETLGVNIWHPYSELTLANAPGVIHLPEPTQIIQKADMKVSAYASGAGHATVTLRGYLAS